MTVSQFYPLNFCPQLRRKSVQISQLQLTHSQSSTVHDRNDA